MNETWNGRLVNWADARVHVGVHALHYGSGVFEGIVVTRRRGGRPSSGSAIACSASTFRPGSSCPCLIRTDLYLADEVFMTGTAAEVTPVRAVDDVEIGVGPVTRELQGAYRSVVTGRDERWAGWLDPVEDGRVAPLSA